MEIEARGDPLSDDWTRLYQILSEAGPDFPQLGLTTPGHTIPDAQEAFLNLVAWNLTNLTLTIPHHRTNKRKPLVGLNVDYKALISYLRQDCQLVVRAACFISKAGVSSPQEALEYVQWCHGVGIQQIVFKEVGIPDDSANSEVTRWCLQNAIELDFSENWEFDGSAKDIFYVNRLVEEDHARPVFVYPWGETVYDINGVNVVFEKSEKSYYGKSIKSVVLSSGHLYARWESEGTILF
jgi:hypothetical protein